VTGEACDSLPAEAPNMGPLLELRKSGQAFE
jgi:hypothetical protein